MLIIEKLLRKKNLRDQQQTRWDERCTQKKSKKNTQQQQQPHHTKSKWLILNHRK